jgi:hypothetical protein
MNKPLYSGHAKYSLHDILLMWANGLIVLALGVLRIQEMKNIFFLIGALALATEVDACFRASLGTLISNGIFIFPREISSFPWENENPMEN